MSRSEERGTQSRLDPYVSPEEMKRLLSSLLVVLGAIGLFSVFAFIVVPGLRNANKPEAGSPVNPPQGETGWLDPTEYPAERGYVAPPVDPKTFMTATPHVLERGKTLYEQDCAPCHGPKGLGDGPGAVVLNPKPRDFTKPEGWVNGYRIPEIFKTLSEGIPNTAMSPFSTLSVTDQVALAHYVQSLGSFPHGGDPVVLEAFASGFARTEQEVPGKIPVSLAMRKLEEEYTPPPPIPLPPASAAPAEQLLRRLVRDPARASRTLAGANGWREDLSVFERAAATGSPENGFAVEVATLRPDQWKALHALLAHSAPSAGGEEAPGPGPQEYRAKALSPNRGRK